MCNMASVFLVGSVLFIFLVFCVVMCVFAYFCLRPLSGVPNVASVSGLSIFDCPFGFLQRLLKNVWPVKICS
jgi:hypothetical protein